MKWIGKHPVFSDLLIGGVLLTPPDPQYEYELTLPNDDGTAGQLLTTDGNGVLTWTTVSPGTGTVTSVGVSGGSTGLTTSGGPITSSGTITIGGTLAVGSGGTGLGTVAADNILTGNGTSPLTAESTLTYNGSQLTHTMTPSGNFTGYAPTATTAAGWASGTNTGYGIKNTFDKDENTAAINTYTGLRNDINDTATSNAGLTQLVGTHNTINFANDAPSGNVMAWGTINSISNGDSQFGVKNTLTGGGTAATTYGIYQTIDDGGHDLYFLSSDATTVDYFSLATGASGETTLTTVDGGGAAAHLNLVVDGQFSVASTGIDISGAGIISNAEWQGTDVAIAHGGTGQSTAQAAIDALTQVSGASAGEALIKDGSGNATWAAQTDTNTNFANTDLTVTGTRVHDLDDNTLTFQTDSNAYSSIIHMDGSAGEITFGYNHASSSIISYLFHSGTNNPDFRIYEDQTHGSNYGKFTYAGALGANRTYTFPDATGTVALTSDITNTTLNGTTAGGIATYASANTLDIEPYLTWDGDHFLIESATTAKPLVEIKSTTNDNKGSELRFVADKGAAGADGDTIAGITWYGDNFAQTQLGFAQLAARVETAAVNDAAGEVELSVLRSNGSGGTGQSNVIKGTGQNDTTVDVELAHGASSTTAIAGELTLGVDLAVTHGGTGLSTVGTNEILTGNGTGALTSESDLKFYSDTLSVGSSTDSGADNIIRNAASTDIDGGDLNINAGHARSVVGNNRIGGNLNLNAGLSTGNAASGRLNFYTGWEGVSGTGQLGPALHTELRSTSAANYMTMYEPTALAADYFQILTTTHGATTISTHDNAADAAHLTLDIDGDIILDSHEANSTSGGIFIANQGTNFAQFTTHHTASWLYLYENGGASTDDYLSIEVGAHGATTIRTEDTAATAADLTLDVDGNIELNAEGGAIDFKDGSATLARLSTDGLNFENNLGAGIIFDGATDDAHQTTLSVIDPTGTRAVNLPDASGTVALQEKSIIVKNMGFYNTSTSAFYLPLLEYIAESTYVTSYVSSFVAPYDGKVIKVGPGWSNNGSSKTSTYKFFKNKQSTTQTGTTATTASFTTTIPEVTPTDWTFTKGEPIHIQCTNSVTIQSVSMTVTIELDLTS